MKQIYEDLWQTKVEQPFAGVNTHAYLLTCKEGNAMIYNTSHMNEVKQFIELGGIAYQYLSHRHESGASLKKIKALFDSRLCCHEDEEIVISKDCQVDITFSRQTVHFAGIEVIPTPGHTQGSLSLLYNSSYGRTYLFTGDTLYRSGNTWGTLVFPSAGGSKEALIKSLVLYRDLSPDVVISSAYIGETPVTEVKNREWRDDISAKIEELKNS